MKKFSIVIPVYNVEKYLKNCLDSCLNQDIPHSDYEIIVVNDGSPDNSQMIIDKYKKEYSNVIKAFKKKNEGLSEARNFGLKKATGDYIAFIDSDDYVETNMISEMIKCARKNNSDIVVCDIFDEYEDKIDVEVCNECHPFYTGAQGKAKKTGKIEKFNRKYGLDKDEKEN